MVTIHWKLAIGVFGLFVGGVLLASRSVAAEKPEADPETQLKVLQRNWVEHQYEPAWTLEDIHHQADRIRAGLCKQGKKQYCPFDVEKLARAVAMAETEGCKTGTGKSRNNCHGIFECKKGKCAPKTFATTAESYTAFKQLWLRKYGARFPTLADAQKYTGSEAGDWYPTVKKVYFRDTEVD